MNTTAIADISVEDDERALIEKIVDRAAQKGLVCGAVAKDHWYKRDTMTLDLMAVHSSICPLDLQRFLEADDFNFLHDVAGIARHIDRKTVTFRQMFRPRYAQRG